MYRTDWFRFQVKVQEAKLLQLDPVKISARRARVLHNRGGSGVTRRELVRDVVAGEVKGYEDAVAAAGDQ